MNIKTIYFALWMLLITGSSLLGEAANPYLDLLIRGDESYYNGNFSKALELYDSARVMLPKETAPLIGLYHTSLKLNQNSKAADYTEKLYQLDSSSINMERRIYGNSFAGHWAKTLDLAQSGKVNQTYSYDLAGQGFFQGGFLLEALRVTNRAIQIDSTYPILTSRKQALEEALNFQQPMLSINNSSMYFSYQKHPVLKSGWYNGFDANLAYLDHSLNFNWSEQRFTAKPLKVLKDSLVSTIQEKWTSVYHVPFTGWDTTIVVTRDSGYAKSNYQRVKLDQPLQREFYLGYQYQIFTGWSAGLSYKYSLAENDIWSKGQTVSATSGLKCGNWLLNGGLTYGQYTINDFKSGLNRADSNYLYQETWDTTYQNSYGNLENDSVFYSYKNDYTTYKPYFEKISRGKTVLQLNLSGGYSFHGLYLGAGGAIRQISDESKWGWQYKTDLAYSFYGLTIWGAYSRGHYLFFNSSDGKILQTAVTMLNAAYETGINWKINRNWQLDCYYGFKDYSDYKQQLYLAGITYNLFK